MDLGKVFLGVVLVFFSTQVRADVTKSVAFLTIKTEGLRDREYCTGFLVSPTEVMTASHCIEKVKKAPLCSRNITIRFPNSKEIKTSCESIAFDSGASSQGDRLDVDYAILKITPAIYTLPPFKLSVEALNDEEDVTVYSMTPLFMGPHFAQFEKKNCRIFRNRFSQLINPFLDRRNFAHSQSPFAFVASQTETPECDLTQGHSGSPMVDSRGNVRGVLRAVAKENGRFFLGVVSSFVCAPVMPAGFRQELPEVCDILSANKNVGSLFRQDIGDPPGNQYVKHYVSDQVSYKNNSKDFPSKFFNGRL